MTGLAESGLFQASALMMGWIGTVELAAHGIAMQAAALAFMVHLGLSNAITVRTGYFDGAGDAVALRDGALVGIGLSLIIGMVMVAGFLIYPAQIVAIFLDMTQPESAQIVAFGTNLMALAALFLIMDAMQVIALGLLRGVQDTRVPMWLAAISYWGIGIPCSYVLAFPLGLGGVGLWLGAGGGAAVCRQLADGAVLGAPLAAHSRDCGLSGRLFRRFGGFGQTVGLAPDQHAAQIVHGQKKIIRDRIQIIGGCFGLRPLRGQVQMIDGAADVINLTLGEHGGAVGQPFGDQGGFGIRQAVAAVGFYAAVLDVDGGDFIHFDTALPVLGIDLEHDSPVLADAEVVVRQIARHVFSLRSIPHRKSGCGHMPFPKSRQK